MVDKQAVGTFHNVLVLQPKAEKESSHHQLGKDAAKQNRFLAPSIARDFKLSNQQPGSCQKQSKCDGTPNRPNNNSPADSVTYNKNNCKQIKRSESESWKRIYPSDFQPFYGTVSSRIYIYAVKPPLLRGPQVGEENEVGFAESSNLMQRLMRKGSKQVQKEAETKQAEEKWCIFDKSFENLSQYDRVGDDSRLHCVLRPFDSTVHQYQIWKQISKAIQNGNLSNTNACYKISENAVHMFFFASKQDMINEWLMHEFSGGVKLEKFE